MLVTMDQLFEKITSYVKMNGIIMIGTSFVDNMKAYLDSLGEIPYEYYELPELNVKFLFVKRINAVLDAISKVTIDFEKDAIAFIQSSSEVRMGNKVGILVAQVCKNEEVSYEEYADMLIAATRKAVHLKKLSDMIGGNDDVHYYAG